MSAENKNTDNKNILNDEEKKEKRDYEKSDKPFIEEGEDKQKESAGKEPGNPSLEKTFDTDNDREQKKQKSGERYGNNENPDEQYSDENGEKGIAKDMNNREREAEKIQENEDKKNDDREIELNKKL